MACRETRHYDEKFNSKAHFQTISIGKVIAAGGEFGVGGYFRVALGKHVDEAVMGDRMKK